MREKRTFAEWMKLVDLAIQIRTGGLTSDDLPDYCYRDAYDNNKSPVAVAHMAVNAAKHY